MAVCMTFESLRITSTCVWSLAKLLLMDRVPNLTHKLRSSVKISLHYFNTFWTLLTLFIAVCCLTITYFNWSVIRYLHYEYYVVYVYLIFIWKCSKRNLLISFGITLECFDIDLIQKFSFFTVPQIVQKILILKKYLCLTICGLLVCSFNML